MRLRNAPLVHVLAEIQVSPIPAVVESSSAIQTAFRERDFPWVESGVTHNITAIAGAPPQIRIAPRWTFLSADRRTSVAITETSVALHTSAYVSIEPFLADFERALGAVEEYARSSYIRRIGMRYIDRVSARRELDDIALYLHPGLLGFPLPAARGLAHLRTETVGISEEGLLAVRSTLLQPGQIVPADLDTGLVTYAARDHFDQVAVAVDFDHYTEFTATPLSFELGSITGHVKRLHSSLRAAFDRAVTEHALKQWGPWDPIS